MADALKVQSSADYLEDDQNEELETLEDNELEELQFDHDNIGAYEAVAEATVVIRARINAKMKSIGIRRKATR